ncbi:MAG: class I SAM-dependent methyltransferase, partial [Desulfobacteraceae bacterium]|nr:class I SAM-dependent methyltransferase [Desulfobacteraceae bacterium]
MNNFTCPICDSFDVEIFIEIDQIPVYCNLLYKIREEALNAPRADMELRFCTKCGHVYNYAFNPDLMDYTQDYENSLHFSPRFQQYANELAHRLVEQYNLYYKDIIEIGCGDGDFLKLLCEIGNNRGVGFDPSHSAEIFSESSGSSIKFISDFYSERYLSHKADFICCRHMLEHVNNPKDFLICLRDTLKIKSKTVFYFEVPSVMFTIKELGIWDLIYEHCSYFNKHSFEHLFETCGFDVFECHDTYNGQFLSVEAVPSIGIVNKRGKINENLHIL